MRNACKKILVMALILASLVSFVHQADAQTITPIFGFNKVWKYDRSGVDRGTAWRTNTFDDTAWQSGAGLLGFEDTPAAITAYTAIAPDGFGVTFPGPLSQTVTTYYFRTTFTLPGNITPTTPGLVLVASNLVDDGCLIWLNGRLAGSLRVAQNANFATLATAATAPEGTNEVVFLSNFLRAGVNTLAVEVHQNTAASSDVVWGMRLNALTPTALAITDQPDSVTADVGDAVSFSVGVSGGPVFYRWQKDGVNLTVNATNSTYSIPSVQLTHAGAYRVIVSNAFNGLTVLTSQVAQLTVVEDTMGPRLVSAIIDDGNGSNRVSVRFDEPLITTVPPTAKSSPMNPANYRLVSTANPSFAYTITNVQRPGPAQFLLSIGDLAWDPRGSYYLTVNNVADRFANQINPNSVIGLSVNNLTNLTQMRDFWDFHGNAFFDPDFNALFTTDLWYRTNYVLSPYWASGRGIFWFDNNATAVLCGGDSLDPEGLINDQDGPPHLFRRTFRVPANLSRDGELRLRYMVDDGMVVYLNGVQIFSNNVPAGPYNQNTRASTALVDPSCRTNVVTVTNLHVGTVPTTNWIAVAVFQANPSGNDVYFGLEMDLVSRQTAQAPTNRAPGTPRIVQTRQADKFVLSWPATNYGYALMYSTDIVGSATNWFKNEANWVQVKDQSNPYTNNIPPTTGPRRFYKLFRERLNN